MTNSLTSSIETFIACQVEHANNGIPYRSPIVGYAAAGDPRFLELKNLVYPGHLLPSDLLHDAQTVVSFFIPFAKFLRKANWADPVQVAPEWADAYIKTNTLIKQITDGLIDNLSKMNIRAAAQPPTHNFNPKTLDSPWAHKSIAVIAGIGSFGLHQMVITDSGCLGRFGSLVIDVAIPSTQASNKHRCLFMHDGSCKICVDRCPVDALSDSKELDKRRCYNRLLEVVEEFKHLGLADVCGKCATGPCALTNPVKQKQEKQ